MSSMQAGVEGHRPDFARSASGASSQIENTNDKHQQQSLDNDRTIAKPSESSNDEENYPPPAQRIVIMVAILLAIFLVSLDRTIIATAIPRMTDEFHSINDIGWYGSAFLLTTCCFQMLWGRIYTFYTPKYIYLSTIVLFEVGSAICGSAPSSTAFIIGRAIAGVGTAGIQNGGIILMVTTVPLAKRPKFQGLIGATFGVSSIVGPLLGGAFTSDVSWRWCFYINLPIGALVLLVIALILKPVPAVKHDLPFKEKLLQLDLLGTLFLLPSIICLLLALQWGGSTYAWSNGRIIALLVLFVVFAISFILVQIFKQNTATVRGSVLFNRSIVAAMCFAWCTNACMIILVYFIPIWFQAIKGVSAVESGIRTIPLVLSLVVGSVFSGVLIGKIGYYAPFCLLSAVVMPIGAGLISTWTTTTGEGHWMGFQILFGIGLGMGMQQALLTAQTVLKKADVPTGVSLMFFIQTMAGAIFLSVGENVFTSHLVSGLTRVLRDLDPQVIVNSGATELRSIVPAADLAVVLEAYNGALVQTFLVATGMASVCICGAVALEWKSVKNGEKKEDDSEKSAVKKESTTEEQV